MEFERKAVALIKAIPRGKVASYSQIAALAGNDRAARQVVRVLHSLSEKEGLPWHRVISSRGKISLPRGRGFEKQRSLLIKESVKVGRDGEIDLDTYLWEIDSGEFRTAERFLKKLLASPTRPGGPQSSVIRESP